MTDNLLADTEEPVLDIDPNKNYLGELVGEGKKVKDPESLAKGKYISDNYIQILERRLDEMRSDYSNLSKEYNARPKLEELINQITQKQSASSEEPVTKETVPAIDPKEIESLVSNKMQEYRASEKAQENFN